MTNKYIEYFPKPFLEDLIEGHVFPIIGAGFSRNAKSDDNKPSLDWDELGRYFAKDIVHYTYNGAIDAISAFEYEYSRSKLIEKMYQALKIGTIHPDEAHKSFAKLPFQLIATTNFDYLLEESYLQSGNKFCRTIIDEEQLPIINNNPKHLNLLKIHGDLSHPSRLVATEEDYDSFISNFPMLATFITNLFISKTVLFIGYSVDDNDIRQLFQMIKNRLGKLKRKAYTIRINSSIQEINRFSRRGINVINIPIAKKDIDYNKVFSDIFEELNDYWLKNMPTNATEEESELDLTLSNISSNRTNRLCFFSIDTAKLPYYKSNLFPIFYKYGFTAVSIDDFVDNTENYLARIKKLIDTSNICIVDLTSKSKYVLSEANIIFNKFLHSNENFNIIIIQDKNDFFSTNHPIYKMILDQKISKTKSSRIHIIDFDTKLHNIDIENLENVVKELSIKIYAKFDRETNLLLENNQYETALLTGFISLEKALRSFFPEQKMYSPLKIFKILFDDKLINQEEYQVLNHARMIRNTIVHGDSTVGIDKNTVIIFLELFEKIKSKIYEKVEK